MKILFEIVDDQECTVDWKIVYFKRDVTEDEIQEVFHTWLLNRTPNASWSVLATDEDLL